MIGDGRDTAGRRERAAARCLACACTGSARVVVVLGGLVVSTLFTLIFVPTLFSLTLDAKSYLTSIWTKAETTSVPESGHANPAVVN